MSEETRTCVRTGQCCMSIPINWSPKNLRDAWEAWRKQVQTLHRVFLEGEPMGAPQLKGLLNREARAKARYDEARLKLLGIPAGAASGGGAAVAAPGPPGPAASASRAGGAP